MHTYIAKFLNEIENPPRDGVRVASSVKVGVFRIEGNNEEQVGEYVRNYPGLLDTFCYFRKDEKDFALFSPDYTATRIMELPSCKDIGGEDPAGGGFCPVEFYVPSYIERESVWCDDRVIRSRVNEPKPEDLLPKTMKCYILDEKTGQRIEVEKPSYPVTPLLYYPFGFVAGCVWGDDSSWKIEYLDLSEAEKGIVKHDARFGYIALPDKSVSLKDAIDMTSYFSLPDRPDPYTRITITIRQIFDLSTGEMVDE